MKDDFHDTSDPSDFQKAERKWASAFTEWAASLRETEWLWEARVADLATGFDEWRTLMNTPLPTVGKWARANRRDPKS